MIFKNKEAYNLILNEEVRIRDFLIKSIHFRQKESLDVEVELWDFRKTKSSKVIMTLEGVTQLDYSYYDDDPRYLEDFKINMRNDVFYLSIDPDNSVAEPVNTDCNFFYFKKLVVNQEL